MWSGEAVPLELVLSKARIYSCLWLLGYLRLLIITPLIVLMPQRSAKMEEGSGTV